MPSWFSGVFGRDSATKYTLANLSALHQQLAKVTVVNDRNRASVVENLRTIAELIIWGDKHDPAFFDFFLEKQILSSLVATLNAQLHDYLRSQPSLLPDPTTAREQESDVQAPMLPSVATGRH